VGFRRRAPLRLLLDTHVVIGELGDGPLVGPNATAIIAAADEIRVSVVSFVEIGIKMSLGKLRVPPRFHELVRESGADLLALTPEHGLGIAELPLHHRDPFDRLLIAQARAEGLTILTGDSRFAAYDVPLVSAVT
jgi:PIN domain nuclease of toxin-antitoxin system